jgi:uncharacterized protein GlcG (DUF336 family)
MREITLEEAKGICEGAVEHGKKIGRPIAVMVMDAHGYYKCFQWTDNGKIGNIELAIKKAWTVVAFKRPSSITAEVSQQPGTPAFGLNVSEPRIFALGGGLVVQDPEDHFKMIGAVGVSGGTIEEDTACCEAGLKAAGFPIEFKGDASMPTKK